MVPPIERSIRARDTALEATLAVRLRTVMSDFDHIVRVVSGAA
jgi:hypothetical protein